MSNNRHLLYNVPKERFWGAGVSGRVVVVGFLALLTWTGLGLVVLNANPSELAARLLFLVLLYAALFATFGLGAYVLSFRIFASKAHRGNLERSLQYGGLWATFTTVAATLRLFRTLNWANGTLLVGLLTLAQFLMFARYLGAQSEKRGRRGRRESKSQ